MNLRATFCVAVRNVVTKASARSGGRFAAVCGTQSRFDVWARVHTFSFFLLHGHTHGHIRMIESLNGKQFLSTANSFYLYARVTFIIFVTGVTKVASIFAKSS